MERLAARPDRDPGRPEVEFYRRHDVIELSVPAPHLARRNVRVERDFA